MDRGGRRNRKIWVEAGRGLGWVPDRCSTRGVRHPLAALLTMAVCAVLGGARNLYAIAIDGKALRGIHGEEIPGVRLVAAYAPEAGLVVGQMGVRSQEAE